MICTAAHIEAILPHVAFLPVHVCIDANAVPETWRRRARWSHVDPIVTRRLAHFLARSARPHPAWLLFFFFSSSPGFFAPWCSSVVSFWTLAAATLCHGFLICTGVQGVMVLIERLQLDMMFKKLKLFFQERCLLLYVLIKKNVFLFCMFL